MPPKTSQCAGCGAEIVWIVTHTGKRAPVDATPTRGYPLTFNEDGTVTADRLAEVHVSHFATCPKADQFRRPQR